MWGEMYFVTFHLEQKNFPTDKGTFDPKKMLSSTHKLLEEMGNRRLWAPFNDAGYKITITSPFRGTVLEIWVPSESVEENL